MVSGEALAAGVRENWCVICTMGVGRAGLAVGEPGLEGWHPARRAQSRPMVQKAKRGRAINGGGVQTACASRV